MSELFRDMRQALRVFPHEPAMCASAVLTFALAVGVTTAVFSILYGVLLRPLPYPGSDRLVRIWEEHPGGTPLIRERLNALTFDALNAGPRSLDGLGAYGNREYTISGTDARSDCQVRTCLRRCSRSWASHRLPADSFENRMRSKAARAS